MEGKTKSNEEDRHKGAVAGTSTRVPRVLGVKLSQLQPNPHQPRMSFDDTSLRELAASIEKSGLIQPIAITKNENGGYTIVAGERRYRAAQLLKRKTIPAVLLTEGSTDELALVENVQREDLHPLEEAMAMAGLMKRHGYTQEVLAKILGKARTTVTNTLKLNSLPKKIRQECSTSNIATKSLLLEIAQLPPEQQLPFWEEVKATRPTVRAARAKKTDRPRLAKAPAELALVAGRNFLKRLQEVSEGSEQGLSKDQIGVLAGLREEILVVISVIEERSEEDGEHLPSRAPEQSGLRSR